MAFEEERMQSAGGRDLALLDFIQGWAIDSKSKNIAGSGCVVCHAVSVVYHEAILRSCKN